MTAVERPMFPLGTVLFPSAFLPLHVFEPRYREMVRDCLAGDREMGVVLIERGSEVGGGDVRTDVGTIATVAEAQELEDGRWALATFGTRRITVERWLPDDPYPRALVADWPDEPIGPDAEDRYRSVLDRLRRVLALRAELGDTGADATIELTDDPELGSMQVAAVGPWGPADRQRLLCEPGPDARLARLAELLVEEESFAQARLRLG